MDESAGASPWWLGSRPHLALRLGIGAGLAIVLCAVANVAALAVAPPGVATSVSNGARDVPLESAIRVVPEGWVGRLDSVKLVEASPNQTTGAQKGYCHSERSEESVAPCVVAATGTEPDQPVSEIQLRLTVLQESWLPGQTEVVVQPSGGALRPDSTYRLTLRQSALAPALPLPRAVPFEWEILFSTPASPRPLPNFSSPELRWGEPLATLWNMPIRDFQVTVAPATNARSWIDSTHSLTSYVLLDDPQEATTYEVTIDSARGADGILLQRPYTYKIVTPARPRLLEDQRSLAAEAGKPVAVRWNAPIERMSYEVTPPVMSAWRLDPRDPGVTLITLEDPEQDASYEISFTEAMARSDAPLAQPQSLTLTTPPALAIADFQTGASGPRVPAAARPTLVFSEPVRDRRAAESAIELDPAVPGEFEWLDARTVQFSPLSGFPYDTEMHVFVGSGPNGARSASGGYLEADLAFSFRTVPDKIIDVDLTRQVLTVTEQDEPVGTFAVATGVAGAATPTGEFFVLYKVPVARFRGVNPSGLRYDIPDVKWVLAFMGDYTIHGAYWRTVFGRPGSNGCISLTDANAKLVYDWSAPGTLVRIHY